MTEGFTQFTLMLWQDVEIVTANVEPRVKLEPSESQNEAASSGSKPKILVKSKQLVTKVRFL